MLSILVYEDGRLSLSSDDAEAENIRVMDAFESAGEQDLYDAWESAPAGDDGVQMMIDEADAKRALNALEDEFPNEVEEAFAERQKLGLEALHVGGGPKS